MTRGGDDVLLQTSASLKVDDDSGSSWAPTRGDSSSLPEPVGWRDVDVDDKLASWMLLDPPVWELLVDARVPLVRGCAELEWGVGRDEVDDGGVACVVDLHGGS